MLRFEQVKKIFKKGTVDEKVAVNDISLHVKHGDFVTVIGSNGAGKTTLLNLVAGLYVPDDGNIFIDGECVNSLPEHRRARYLGRIFQDPLMGTAASMTIEENLAMADLRGQRRGLGRGINPARRKYYRQSLAMLDLGLEQRLKDSVSLLSGGQRQSLTLLMATLAMPKVLLLDEHTAALDPKTAQKVMDLTDRIINENALTTVMVTHNMQQAIRYGNRMVMLHEGRVKFDVEGLEKQALTVEEVVRRFGSELKDEALLC
ncbi:MAG: ATP-binding cassette domain-containing protein [Desulfatiglandaceae bacterium]